MVRFDVPKEDMDLIIRIAQRANAEATKAGIDYPAQDAAMDLTAVHRNGCPLKLRELAETEGYDFLHDVFGIRRHINRRTGQLEDCFLPRFAEPSRA
jgi:hypothetical protein